MFAKNFRVAAAMKTSVLLSWEVPDSYKSAIPFKVGEGHGQPSPYTAIPVPPWAFVCVCDAGSWLGVHVSSYRPMMGRLNS